jgi:putative membrane protein
VSAGDPEAEPESGARPPRPDLPRDVVGWPPREAGWHRLHPLSPVVRAGRGLLALVIIFSPRLFSGGKGQHGSVVDLVIVGVILGLGVISWLVTRWAIEDGTLRIETGLIRRSSLRFPLVQIQAIDIVRPALARVFGLAELRLRMGGSTGKSGRLAYLTVREADILRARLLALAHGIAADSPPPPEQVLLSVPAGRLIGSILVSRLGLVVEAVVLALIITAAVAPAAAAQTIAAGALSLITLLGGVWRRFNSGYNLTVAEAADGLRLRSGLLQTTAETIPRGRVQAMRMIEPLLWRPLGWCRVQVDVAGRQRTEGENQGENRSLRAVLPVGTREEARLLLDRILPGAPEGRIPAPSRARMKSPFRYHYLSWGRTETCAVTTSGRVARITDWVPLAKVQSLRWVQGPVQRRLRLASIHLDTAGRSVHAAIRDRDGSEADRVLVELTALCRAARQASNRR